MKTKILGFLLLSLVNLNLKAQPIQREYDTCSALQQRAGEYISINGADTIRIYLRYHRSLDLDRNMVWDILWGWHEYKQGNTIVQSTYMDRFMNLPYNTTDIERTKYSMWLSYCRTPDTMAFQFNTNCLTGNIIDAGYEYVSHRVKANFITNKQGVEVLRWEQNFAEAGCLGCSNMPLTMILPKVFILRKL